MYIVYITDTVLYIVNVSTNINYSCLICKKTLKKLVFSGNQKNVATTKLADTWLYSSEKYYLNIKRHLYELDQV